MGESYRYSVVPVADPLMFHHSPEPLMEEYIGETACALLSYDDIVSQYDNYALIIVLEIR